MRSVHLDAQPNHAQNVIYPFQTFAISCNTLHATILKIIQKNDRTLCQTKSPEYPFGAFSSERHY
ncbi:hypothetical protein HMPREF9065_00026 [Aggregatibacter sp. oral taxon 458 str. W10330]|nr:hypothetical protein HMPREF9065_00026 [Aggregatibacter sp. oral taxon 458 str. W10330]